MVTFKNLVIVFVFSLLLFWSNTSIFAVESKPSERWVCLKSDYCADQASHCSGQGLLGHRTLLSTKEDAKLLPNTNTYILECLATAEGQVCTTGSTNNDMLIYGKDNTLSLSGSDNYQFQGIFTTDGETPANNPVKSKKNGDIDRVEWQSYSKGNNRKFLALNYFYPSGGANDSTGKGGQQQGTFSFETQSNLKDCVSIAWDPFGRIFDSQTLEPIPDVTVELLKKRGNGLFTRFLSDELFGGTIENPYVTKENGYYSFVVPDATYKLSMSQQNYTFPNNKTKLNQDYIKAYSDIYPNNTGLEIVQAGSIQHRDIPLDPKGAGFSYPVKLIEYFYNLDKSSNKILIEGLMSHPLTKVRLFSLKSINDTMLPTRYKLIKTLQTDTYGRFKAEFDQSLFEPTETFGEMEFEKVDLTKQVNTQRNFLNFVYSVNAAQFISSSVRLNPILGKLQGYAYDERKQIIPNAMVGIYLKYANKPYFETKADKQGLYKIASDKLPDTPFTIKYSLPGKGTIVVTTTKFVIQNTPYLTKNKINLNSIKTTPSSKTRVDNPKFLSREIRPLKTLDSLSTQSLKQQPSANKISQNNTLFMFAGVILFILIGIVGLMLGIYVLRKNKRQNHIKI